MAQQGGKSVKLFNLEERKYSTGTITEVDIFQWKNTLLDNLRREPEFTDLCKDTSQWEFEKVENRGFQDTEQGDGLGRKKADRVNSMLTKIASYAPKSIVREITRRTRCLADIWNIARDWTKKNQQKYQNYYNILNEVGEEKSIKLLEGGAWQLLHDDEYQLV